VIADLDVALLFGLANSAHCAGMCGPFAVAASGGAARLSAFLAGKAFAYVFLGAVAGAIGGGLSATSATLGAWIGALTGALMVAAGLLAMARAGRGVVGADLGVRLLRRLPAGAGPFTLGVITGALPCGVLALAVLRALAQPSAAHGAGFMLAFATGTAPSLVVAALTGRGLLARLGPRRAAFAGGALLVLAGALALMRASHVGSHEGCPACSS
jgi:sulfite exporter TauE/SafE